MNTSNAVARLLLAAKTILGGPASRRWDELGLTIHWSADPESANRVLQQPACLFILQGSKLLHHGGRRWVAGPGDLLLVNLPTLVVCDAAEMDATSFVAVTVDLNMRTLADWATHEFPPRTDRVQTRRIQDGLHLAPLYDALADALFRLLALPEDDLAMRALGPSRLAELHFWLLRGPLGRPLLEFITDRHRLDAVVKAVNYMRAHPEQSMSMEALARELAMSPSSFYDRFGKVMGTSPLQFLKVLRLNHARQLLLQGGWRVHQVAAEVGYASPGQFSREFRRTFGKSPSAVVRRT